MHDTKDDNETNDVISYTVPDNDAFKNEKIVIEVNIDHETNYVNSNVTLNDDALNSEYLIEVTKDVHVIEIPNDVFNEENLLQEKHIDETCTLINTNLDINDDEEKSEIKENPDFDEDATSSESPRVIWTRFFLVVPK